MENLSRFENILMAIVSGFMLCFLGFGLGWIYSVDKSLPEWRSDTFLEFCRSMDGLLIEGVTNVHNKDSESYTCVLYKKD